MQSCRQNLTLLSEQILRNICRIIHDLRMVVPQKPAADAFTGLAVTGLMIDL